jgi:NAD(P)-dependent dehydrogenase (short-subunit alcohol dehydrogenase family)
MCSSMSDNKVWLVTGAGRGLGVDIAKAGAGGWSRGGCHRTET